MSTQNISPVFPLEETEDGKYKIVGINDLTTAVDQNIKMVLLTRKGEKIGRPAFGVGLHDYLFEIPNNIQSGFSQKPPLRANIINQLSTYIPYISLEKVEVNFVPNQRILKLKIQYHITDSDVASTFELTLQDTDAIQLY